MVTAPPLRVPVSYGCYQSTVPWKGQCLVADTLVVLFANCQRALSAQPLDQIEGPPVHERFGSPADKIFAVAAGGNSSMMALEVGS
jgi:hypothetical protein